MLGLTFGLGVALGLLLRRPDRWARVLESGFWLRCISWTVVLTSAATVGIAAAEDASLEGPIVAVGAAALVFAVAMWINAR
jgi:hypothetical protein